MSQLITYDLYEIKRAAYRDDRHIPTDVPRKTARSILNAGYAIECDCGCEWFALNAAGIELARANGITRTRSEEQVRA